MNLKLPITENDIDALVRSYLDGESHGVDVASQLDAIESRRIAGETTPSLLPWENTQRAKKQARRFRVLGIRKLVVAATLFLAASICLYLALSPEPAGAYALVHGAQGILSAGKDRCYQVQGNLPPGWVKSNPFLEAGDDTVVWVRANRFRVQSSIGNQKIVWGQDAGRNVWVADIEGNRAFRFASGEVPALLQRPRFVLGLDLRRLVLKLLQDYDLDIKRTEEEGEISLVQVEGTRKPTDKFVPFDSASMVIEANSKVIRSLELRRMGPRQTPVRVTFTLVDQTTQPEGSYRAESYLSPGGKIWGPGKPAERDQEFWKWINSLKESLATS